MSPRPIRSTAPTGLPVTVIALAALILGCGGGDNGGPIAPPERVFSSLSVNPTSAAICTVDPGNTVTLTVSPHDQNGQPMTGLGNPSFTNSNANAVAVDANGLVRALAQGAAHITASLTGHGTTHTAAATITVASAPIGGVSGSVSENHPLPHIAAITPAQLGVGGAVSLRIQGQAFHSHTLTLNSTQMMQIAAGCRTSQTSSLDPHSNGSGAHTHLVTFN